MTTPTRVFGSAEISKCGRYRYELTRSWDASKPTIAFVMLNPSTADAAQDDATIRKCIRFAQRWGYGEMRVYNLFALRATNPDELNHHPDPVGPDYVCHIAKAGQCDKIICAWGSFEIKGEHADRARRMHTIMLAGRDLYALAVNQDGNPRHPLYVRGDTDPELWSPPA